MDLLKREFELLDRFSARWAAVLIRLAVGKTISQTARELEMSRTTVHRMLKIPEFRRALIEEQRHLIATGVIEDRCLAYRRKILKCVIRTFSKLEGSMSRLNKFKKYLDTIDEQSGMDRML